MKSLKITAPNLFNAIVLAWFISILTINLCCTKEKIAIQNYKEDYNYYPARIGTSWYYEVDSLIFNQTLNGLEIDSLNYKVREIITDTIRINGKLIYTIDKYKRIDQADPWEISSVYTLQFDDNQVYRTEENQQFIKLSLPLISGKAWDANSYLDKETEVQIGGETLKPFINWESKPYKINLPYNNGWINFDSTTTIELVDHETLLDIRQGYEVYARNYGLVYRYLKVLDTQCNGNPSDCKDIPWEIKADKGFIVIQKLTGFQW